MLLTIWRIALSALLGASIGYVIAGQGAVALGALLALVVGGLRELERSRVGALATKTGIRR